MSDDIPGSDELPRAPRITDDDRAAARRAVLWRYDRGLLTAMEARNALDAIDLLRDAKPLGVTA